MASRGRGRWLQPYGTGTDGDWRRPTGNIDNSSFRPYPGSPSRSSGNFNRSSFAYDRRLQRPRRVHYPCASMAEEIHGMEERMEERRRYADFGEDRERVFGTPEGSRTTSPMTTHPADSRQRTMHPENSRDQRETPKTPTLPQWGDISFKVEIKHFKAVDVTADIVTVRDAITSALIASGLPIWSRLALCVKTSAEASDMGFGARVEPFAHYLFGQEPGGSTIFLNLGFFSKTRIVSYEDGRHTRQSVALDATASYESREVIRDFLRLSKRLDLMFTTTITEDEIGVLSDVDLGRVGIYLERTCEFGMQVIKQIVGGHKLGQVAMARGDGSHVGVALVLHHLESQQPCLSQVVIDSKYNALLETCKFTKLLLNSSSFLSTLALQISNAQTELYASGNRQQMAQLANSAGVLAALRASLDTVGKDRSANSVSAVDYPVKFEPLLKAVTGPYASTDRFVDTLTQVASLSACRTSKPVIVAPPTKSPGPVPTPSPEVANANMAYHNRRERKSNSPPLRGTGKCSLCNELGHWFSDCPVKEEFLRWRGGRASSRDRTGERPRSAERGRGSRDGRKDGHTGSRDGGRPHSADRGRGDRPSSRDGRPPGRGSRSQSPAASTREVPRGTSPSPHHSRRANFVGGGTSAPADDDDDSFQPSCYGARVVAPASSSMAPVTSLKDQLPEIRPSFDIAAEDFDERAAEPVATQAAIPPRVPGMATTLPSPVSTGWSVSTPRFLLGFFCLIVAGLTILGGVGMGLSESVSSTISAAYSHAGSFITNTTSEINRRIPQWEVSVSGSTICTIIIRIFAIFFLGSFRGAHGSGITATFNSTTPFGCDARYNECRDSQSSFPFAYSAQFHGTATGDTKIDSGANNSIFSDRSCFIDLVDLPAPLYIAGIKGSLKITQQGTVRIRVCDSLGLPHDVVLHNVNYTSAANSFGNLISVRDLNKCGYDVNFPAWGAPSLVYHGQDPASTSGKNATTIPLVRQDGMFSLFKRGVSNFTALAARRNPSVPGRPAEVAWLLHKRFHAGAKAVLGACNTLPSLSGLGLGLRLRDFPFTPCHVCREANATRLNRPPASETVYATEDSVMSMDMFDLGESCRTTGGNRYVLIFVVARSRYIHVELLQNKSDSFQAFKRATTRLGFKPKDLRCDNALEFISDEFNRYCEDNGINRQRSVPYEQYQNGMAEAAVDVLGSRMRAFLLQSGLPQEFWGFALRYAVDTTNHLQHSSTGAVPILVHGRQDYADWFRPFGCRAWVHVGKNLVEHGKISARGVKGIFVGVNFTAGQKAWLVYVPETNEVVPSAQVTFDETYFPLLAPDQRRQTYMESGHHVANGPILSRSDATNLLDFVLTPDSDESLADPPAPVASSAGDVAETVSGSVSVPVVPSAGGQCSSDDFEAYKEYMVS